MRIVLAGSTILSNGGGIASYNIELCRVLLSQGHKLLVITTEKTEKTCIDIDGNNVLLYSTEIAENVFDELKVVAKMFKTIVEYDPDVLISSDHIYLTSLFGCFADHRIKISVSHFYNGLLPKTSACRFEYTDWIVSLSQVGRDYLVKLGCCPEQVKVIYNSVTDLADAKFVIDNKTKPIDIITLVYPGGGNRQKSPEIICKLVHKLEKASIDWKLIWLGDADKYQKKLMPKFKNRILFTGQVPREQAEDYIKQAQCFLLPSRGEGCPMSLLEAMRTGAIPMVSSVPCAMRELVVNGKSGYVTRRTDVLSIKHNIVKIFKSQELRKNLILGSRRTYEEKLSTECWLNNIGFVVSRKRLPQTCRSKKDEYDASKVIRWARHSGRWYCPTIRYLRTRFARPNFSPIVE